MPKYVVINRDDNTFWAYTDSIASINPATQSVVPYNELQDPEGAGLAYYTGLVSSKYGQALMNTLKSQPQETSRTEPVLVKSNITAVGGKLFISTAGGPITITLPADPKISDTLEFMDSFRGGVGFNVNNLTIGRNGNTIMGLAEDMIVDEKGICFGLTWNGSDWRLC